MNYTYKTNGVCATQIDFQLDGNVVTNIKFTCGCPGNLAAIPKILDGWTVEDIESKLRGHRCGFRETSCADQLAIAVREAYEESKK